MIEENNEKNDNQTKTDKYLDPQTKKFKKGNPGGGRTKGTRDWATDFNLAVKQIAKETKQTISQVRTDLLVKGIREAKNGNFNFWQELIQRDYGKTSQPIEADINVKGAKELADQLQNILEEEDDNNDEAKESN